MAERREPLGIRSVILGTAGHIDHGKTALVHALTGVDTDRLQEEKERGITIDLGFAEFAPGGDLRFGVVDVPGHEGFVRNMVAGATGMDVVLLVVAADEGVMPQTREHLAIVEQVGARRLVVAITKADRVEEAWLELVRDEVRETIEGGPYRDAPIVVTSARTGMGLEKLTRALLEEARGADPRYPGDLFRLPVDRIFTVRGTGTVITGTVWSGAIRSGDEVRLLPEGGTARIRNLQVHGRDVEVVGPGERAAAALTGPDLEERKLERGVVLVSDAGWKPTTMLTVRLRRLPSTAWPLEHGQRIRVHLGTAEVLARIALLEGEEVPQGGEAWAHLRLERSLVARTGDPFVVRSYSPVTTIGGGEVMEPLPPKRTHLQPGTREHLLGLATGAPHERLAAALDLAAWGGIPAPELPVRTGLAPDLVSEEWARLRGEGKGAGQDVRFGPRSVTEGKRLLLAAVEERHRHESLSPGLPLEELRQALPGTAAREELASSLLDALCEDGRLEIDENRARIPGFRPRPTPAQRATLERLRARYREAGIAPPAPSELSPELASREELERLHSYLLHEGELVRLDETFWAWKPAVDEAARRVQEEFGGRGELGPSDFRRVLPVSRRHLIPLLQHFDTRGITVRTPEGRKVSGPS